MILRTISGNQIVQSPLFLIRHLLYDWSWRIDDFLAMPLLDICSSLDFFFFINVVCCMRLKNSLAGTTGCLSFWYLLFSLQLKWPKWRINLGLCNLALWYTYSPSGSPLKTAFTFNFLGVFENISSIVNSAFRSRIMTNFFQAHFVVLQLKQTKRSFRE